jgi:hypothetical protein
MEKYALGRGRRKWDGDADWKRGLERVVENWTKQVRRMGAFRGEGVLVDLLEVSGAGPQYWLSVEGGAEVKVDGKELMILKESDILAVIE